MYLTGRHGRYSRAGKHSTAGKARGRPLCLSGMYLGLWLCFVTALPSELVSPYGMTSGLHHMCACTRLVPPSTLLPCAVQYTNTGLVLLFGGLARGFARGALL